MSWKRAAITVAVLSTVMLHAQFETVVMRPVKAKSPSGTIQGRNGEPVAGAKVQLVDCPIGRSYAAGPNKVLAELITDQKGNFVIDAKRFHAPYCFHVQSPGFDNLEVEVKISHFAKPLTLKLNIAT